MMMHFSECIPFAKQCMTTILILTYFGEKILILKKFRKVPTKYTYIKFIKLKVIRTQEQLMTQKIKIEHSRELQNKTGVGIVCVKKVGSDKLVCQTFICLPISRFILPSLLTRPHVCLFVFFFFGLKLCMAALCCRTGCFPSPERVSVDQILCQSWYWLA